MQLISLPNPQAFYKQVWKIVRQVPRGRVVTYGQIARMIPLPPEVSPEEYATFGARWVGGAMADSPDGVPWQRVINAQGKISRRPGADLQRRLLEEEGIPFNNDKIDLKKYQWRPGEEDQPRQAKLF